MAATFHHDRHGRCELIRIEGVDWIIRCCSSGETHRVSPSHRGDYVLVPLATDGEKIPDDREAFSNGSTEVANNDASMLFVGIRNGLHVFDKCKQAEVVARKPEETAGALIQSSIDQESEDSRDPRAPSVRGPNAVVMANLDSSSFCNRDQTDIILRDQTHPQINDSEGRRLRRVFESLRNGLVPINADSRRFAVGFEDIQRIANNLFDGVAKEGGSGVVIRGAYGQGKTFCLQILREMALENGYAVATVEIDSTENRLDLPHSVFRSLMQRLVLPGERQPGARTLVEKTLKALEKRLKPSATGRWNAKEAYNVLLSAVECGPLVRLLSSPALHEDEHLICLLGNEPAPARQCRGREFGRQASHIAWPRFRFGTQGDFATYLLSGIGRLTQFLGYKGLILILDEMEKWQGLNWEAQEKAGSFLGGLIWAARASKGSRYCRRNDGGWYRDCDHCEKLIHSRISGGYPFTTEKRCFIGLAIAMTPRGDDGPERLWSEYGTLTIADLRPFAPSEVSGYIDKILPAFRIAYNIAAPLPVDLPHRAVAEWRISGDGSTRTAVQAVMKTLDEWRQLQ